MNNSITNIILSNELEKAKVAIYKPIKRTNPNINK